MPMRFHHGAAVLFFLIDVLVVSAHPVTGKEAAQKLAQLHDDARETIAYEGEFALVPKMTIHPAGKMPIAKVIAMGEDFGTEPLKQPNRDGVWIRAMWVLDHGSQAVFLQEFGETETPRGGFAVPGHLAAEHVTLTPYAMTNTGEIREGHTVQTGSNEHVQEVYGKKDEL